MRRYRRAWILMVLATALLAPGCDNDDGGAAVPADVAGGDSGADVGEPAAASLATTLGLTKYVGRIAPVLEAQDGAERVYTFDVEQGPMCMRGDPFRTSIRETDSDSLVIFLQGGGACWTEFCLAVTKAPAGIPNVDVLRSDLPENPVAEWDVVYLPYCDGSFFAGDAEHDDDIYGKGPRYHRGLANLTGALEVARRHFPEPDRILLAGSSGGAYGMALATPLVRHYYPEAELIVMADSGIGVGRDGDEAYMQTLLDQFDLERRLPEDCEGCRGEGHLTGMFGYLLERDDDLRIGTFGSWYDGILASTFLQIPGAQFARGLKEQTDRLHVAFPDRFRRFIVDGIQHTSLLGDPTGIIGTDLTALEAPPGSLTDLLSDVLILGINDTELDGQSMAEWLSALIANDLERWTDKLAPMGTPPDADGE